MAAGAAMGGSSGAWACAWKAAKASIKTRK
jgi:hypothetical protein